MDAHFAGMLEAAHSDLVIAGFDENSIAIECSLDLRYVGQSYELTVPYSAGYRTDFDRLHQMRFGYHNEHRACEIVNLRVKAVGCTEKPALAKYHSTKEKPALPIRTSAAVFNHQILATAFFRRESLLPGMFASGPAIIAGGQATTVVPPGWNFNLDFIGTLVLTRSAQ